jgi:hypothetical protein
VTGEAAANGMPGQQFGQLGSRFGIERRESNALDHAAQAVGQARQFGRSRDRTAGGGDEQRRIGQPPRQQVNGFEAGRVSPLQVIQRQQQRLVDHRVADRFHYPVEQLVAQG